MDVFSKPAAIVTWTICLASILISMYSFYYSSVFTLIKVYGLRFRGVPLMRLLLSFTAFSSFMAQLLNPLVFFIGDLPKDIYADYKTPLLLTVVVTAVFYFASIVFLTLSTYERYIRLMMVMPKTRTYRLFQWMWYFVIALGTLTCILVILVRISQNDPLISAIFYPMLCLLMVWVLATDLILNFWMIQQTLRGDSGDSRPSLQTPQHTIGTTSIVTAKEKELKRIRIQMYSWYFGLILADLSVLTLFIFSATALVELLNAISSISVSFTGLHIFLVLRLLEIYRGGVTAADSKKRGPQLYMTETETKVTILSSVSPMNESQIQRQDMMMMSDLESWNSGDTRKK